MQKNNKHAYFTRDDSMLLINWWDFPDILITAFIVLLNKELVADVSYSIFQLSSNINW